MDIFEISGFKSGIDKSGVNFLDPADAFESLENGYIYRQELVSRKGFTQFADQLVGDDSDDSTRVMGIFENILPDESVGQLLVITKKYLYKYDSGTNTFVEIPFNTRINDLVAPAKFNFGISDNADYVSGTTYLTKDGEKRFVFTGNGISEAPETIGENYSAVYFFDGEKIGDFFNIQDNPDVQEPAASIGNVIRAQRVIWFAERLNLFIPTTRITALATTPTYHQAVLFSGRRNKAGDGDKFNVSGAGLREADTYEKMVSATILGDFIVMNFQRSNWTIEKTGDAFNPYFIRKIPSVLGTGAPYSSVSWNYEVKSMGNTGLITTDGRQSLRFDNMIPYFTQDEISQTKFTLVYGGFDRRNGQFLFSYPSSDSDTTQDKVLVYNYEEKTWSVNDQQFSCFGETDAGMNLTWDDIYEANNPSWARWDTTEEIWDKIGLGAATQKTLAGDDNGFVYQINTDDDDSFYTVTAITNAASAVITIGEHTYEIGNEVILENVVGLLDENENSAINDIVFTVTAIAATTITINLDSTNLTAYDSGGSVSGVINFSAKTTVFNPYRDRGRKCNLSHLEFLIETRTGSSEVDIYEDEEDLPFKTITLTTDPTTNKKREWITAIVNDEADFFTFVIRKKTVTNQKILTAIRIHSSEGSLNAG